MKMHSLCKLIACKRQSRYLLSSSVQRRRIQALVKPLFLGCNFSLAHCASFSSSSCLNFIRTESTTAAFAESSGRSSCSAHRVLFFGSDRFSLETLKLLHQNLQLEPNNKQKCIHELHVCTKSDKNIVSRYSVEAKLKISYWPPSIQPNVYDVGVVVSFAKLLPDEIIHVCRFGILNVHASLLPKLRGASPIHHAILQSLPETGVTIMRISPDAFDVGEILLQERIPLNKDSRASQIYMPLAQMGARLMLQCLQNLPHCLEQAVAQSNSDATYAKKIQPAAAQVHWTIDDLNTVYRKFRAFDGQDYGFISLYARWINGNRIELTGMLKPEETDNLHLDENIPKYTSYKREQLVPGFVFYYNPCRIICIKCADGRWAGFKTVALKNHRRMSAMQFNQGFIAKMSEKNTKPLVLQ